MKGGDSERVIKGFVRTGGLELPRKNCTTIWFRDPAIRLVLESMLRLAFKLQNTLLNGKGQKGEER